VAALLARALPRHLRAAWPVLELGGTIVWVPGVWQAEPAAPPSSLVVEVFRT
jgi:hypothetical protein